MKRYVDDRNQLANVVYNVHTGKLVGDNSLDVVETEE